MGESAGVESELDIEYIKSVAAEVPLTVVYDNQYSLLSWATQITNLEDSPVVIKVFAVVLVVECSGMLAFIQIFQLHHLTSQQLEALTLQVLQLVTKPHGRVVEVVSVTPSPYRNIRKML